jgi:hypothetical protein
MRLLTIFVVANEIYLILIPEKERKQYYSAIILIQYRLTSQSLLIDQTTIRFTCFNFFLLRIDNVDGSPEEGTKLKEVDEDG